MMSAPPPINRNERYEVTDEEITAFVDDVMVPVRAAMLRTIGDRSTKAFDAADEIAEAVDRGIRRAFERLGERTA